MAAATRPNTATAAQKLFHFPITIPRFYSPAPNPPSAAGAFSYRKLFAFFI
jgi:hypothetical protein